MSSIAQRGRPAGEVRQAIFNTLQNGGELPLATIAQQAQVGYDACRATLSNAVRSGRVEIVGHTKVAHAKQWVAMYALAEQPGRDEAPNDATPALVVLDAAMRSWF